MSRISRRQFVTFCASLAGTILLQGLTRISRAISHDSTEVEPSLPPSREKTQSHKADGLGTTPATGKRFAMVIDSGACIGCRTCQYACKEENNTPDTITPPWIEAFELKNEVTLTGQASIEDLKAGATTSYTSSPREGHWYLTAHCNHCDNPACVKVCPTGATYKAEDGLVLMDYDKCVGCRFCVVACPYNVRRFNWSTPELDGKNINPLVPVRYLGVVEKCTFCVHRTRVGRLPRCVEVCPVNAKHFGDLNDPNSEVSKLLNSNASIRLLEEQNTKPNIWYIGRGKKFTR